jgi:hypothetical protein
MKKFYLIATVLCFLLVKNTILAQNTSKRNEFSIYTGINKNDLMVTKGNTLGAEVQHKFNKKLGVAVSWTLGNGYKIYYRDDPRNTAYWYMTNSLSLTLSPFKKDKWRLGAGYVNQYLPDASFLTMYLPWCGTGFSNEQLSGFTKTYLRIRNSHINFHGINCYIQRKIRISKSNNLFFRLDLSKFGGFSEFIAIDKYKYPITADKTPQTRVSTNKHLVSQKNEDLRY